MSVRLSRRWAREVVAVAVGVAVRAVGAAEGSGGGRKRAPSAVGVAGRLEKGGLEGRGNEAPPRGRGRPMAQRARSTYSGRPRD